MVTHTDPLADEMVAGRARLTRWANGEAELVPGDVLALMSVDSAWRQRMLTLLKQLGEPGHCRGCNADVYWVTGKRSAVPVTPTGLNHFVDCSAADQFRRKK